MVSAMTPPYFTNGAADGQFFDEKALLDNMSPPALTRQNTPNFTTISPKLPLTEEWRVPVDMQSQPSSSSSIPSDAPVTTAPFFPTGGPLLSNIGGPNSANAWVMTQGPTGLPIDGLAMSNGQFVDDMNGFDMFANPSAAMMPGNPTFANIALYGGISPMMPGASNAMSMGHVGTLDALNAVANGGSKKSPSIQAVLQELRRGDGIRKKNARFEIPPDRKLSNIDQLIAQSTDEQEIKELKMQKRLLRNRQAALDSRYRKKLHTERLEDEKKQYTAIINDFETQVSNLRKEVERLHLEKQQYENFVQTLTLEKETLVRESTSQKRELRKKLSALSAHTKRLENEVNQYRGTKPAITPTSNNGLVNVQDGSNDWETAYVDLGVEPDVKSESTTTTTAGSSGALRSINQSDKAPGAGVLFTLFLVGAYVVAAGRGAANVPAVSEAVREEAKGVLASLYKDAGIVSAPGAAPVDFSGINWVVSGGQKTTGTVGDLLTQVTKSDNVFSMGSPAFEHAVEYVNPAAMSLSYGNSPILGDVTGSSGVPKDQRNLSGALSVIRGITGVAAAVQRSLLREMVPVDVVRSFASLIADASGPGPIPMPMPSARA